MNKRKHFILAVILALILVIVFLIFLTIKQNRQIVKMKGALTHLLKGERIDYFDLVGTDNRRVDASLLNNGKPHLIFIPKQPCISCNTNQNFYKRLAIAVNDEVEIYGIWLGSPQEMFDYQETAHPGFTYYSPVDMDKFKNQLRLQHNYAHSILYMNNNVDFIRLETLDGDDYTYILRTIKKFLKNNKAGKGGE